MMRSLFVSVLFILAAGVTVSAFRNLLTPAAMIIYSFLALGLVFALLWSVIANQTDVIE